MTPEQLARAIRQQEEAAGIARRHAEAARARGDTAEADAQEQKAQAYLHSASGLWSQLWDELRPQVQRLVALVFRKFQVPLTRAGLEPAELEGELFIEFARRVGRFDPDRRCRLWTFMEHVLRNKLYTILRKIRRDEHGKQQLDKEELEEAVVAPADEEWAVRGHVLELCQQLLREGWRKDYLLAYQHYQLDGLTQTQLAQQMKKSVGWANKAIQTINDEIQRRW